MTIIDAFRECHWDQAAMQQWFGDLLAARECGRLSATQAHVLQHEQLVLEQLGMPPTLRDAEARCTLKQLATRIFERVAKTATAPATAAATTEGEDAQQLCEQQTHLFFLNATFGLVLHKTLAASADAEKKGAGVVYNSGGNFLLASHGRFVCRLRVVVQFF